MNYSQHRKSSIVKKEILTYELSRSEYMGLRRFILRQVLSRPYQR